MFLAFAAALTVATSAPTAADRTAIDRLVSTIADTAPMSVARIGVSIVDVATDQVIYERDAGKEFAPASNLKLVTGAAALAVLGGDFHFTTSLIATGRRSGGELSGDLILDGGGDPVLSSADLKEAARAVVAAGIRKVDGAIRADDTRFDEQRYAAGWAWDDFPYYYQPPIEALSVDEGLATLAVSAAPKAGDAAAVALTPDVGAMTVRSDAITVAAGGPDDVDCFRSPGSPVIRIVGHIPIGSAPETLHCAVDDSAAYTVAVFARLLATQGVDVGARAAAAPDDALDVEDPSPAPAASLPERSPDAVELWTHDSPPLTAILGTMMPPSDNFIAEHLFKMLPVVALHQRGTFDGGLAVEQHFLQQLGLDPKSLDGSDGSGLSQGDRVTPHDLAALLAWEARSPSGDPVVHALAQAGIYGTVRHRLLGSDAVGRVRAKDGYIWHVSTFSGYAQTRRHGLVAFSVMVNDAVGPLDPYIADEDKIVEQIVDWP